MLLPCRRRQKAGADAKEPSKSNLASSCLVELGLAFGAMGTCFTAYFDIFQIVCFDLIFTSLIGGI